MHLALILGLLAVQPTPPELPAQITETLAALPEPSGNSPRPSGADWLLVEEPAPSALTHGPFVGHVDMESALLWARVDTDGEYVIVAHDAKGVEVERARARASASGDRTLLWRLEHLEPAQLYRYTIRAGERTLAGGDEFVFRTAPPPTGSGRVRIAFGSCAHEGRFPRQPIWTRIGTDGSEVVVLLGDTPYIDSTDLEVQRQRYRDFYTIDELATLLRTTPFYATWDDHDFGRNDTNGKLPGKEKSRQAFLEYHANPSYGDGAQGIYTRFRRGPVDVFLLDTRWFAATESSPAADDRPTLLGARQWKWLLEELAASNAPFKILACGMIWNGATRPNKPDHWMSYPHEREALFREIGTRRIEGVVLVGGDIHRSRALRYPTQDSAGYPLTELITSPLANTIIEAANAPSPHLLHDAGEPQSYLLVTADPTVDPPTLTARCRSADGRDVFTVRLTADELTPRK